MTPRYCEHCGYQLTPTTQFCPQCGKAAAPPAVAMPASASVPPAPVVPERTVTAATPAPPRGNGTPPPSDTRTSHIEPAARTAPPPATAPVHHGNRRVYMIAGVALLVVVALGVLLLGRLPVGGERLERKTVETDAIEEGSAPTAQAPLGVEEQPALVPPMSSSQTPPNSDILGTTGDPASGTMPPPMVSGSPEPEAAPPQAPVPPPVQVPADAPNVSSDDAIARVRAAVRDHLDVADDCISVANQGYVNVGYTLTATNVCSGASLGKWRVDARNGDVFQQKSDGRYLRP